LSFLDYYDSGRAGKQGMVTMDKPKLMIASRNYGSWSLRGWLLCKMAGLDVDVHMAPPDDASTRAELLLLSPSFLVPSLTNGQIKVWDTLAIAEYLNELFPEAGLLPKDAAARARCRSVSGEMHSGFSNMRSALPMNIKGHYPGFKVWVGAQADIDRIVTIWHECLSASPGPFLFGATPCMADAMYAPVCSRFLTYNVKIDAACTAYCHAIMTMPHMGEWIEAARSEPDDVMELDVEF